MIAFRFECEARKTTDSEKAGKLGPLGLRIEVGYFRITSPTLLNDAWQKDVDLRPLLAPPSSTEQASRSVALWRHLCASNLLQHFLLMLCQASLLFGLLSPSQLALDMK